jgi:hypothetical protein
MLVAVTLPLVASHEWERPEPVKLLSPSVVAAAPPMVIARLQQRFDDQTPRLHEASSADLPRVVQCTFEERHP